MNTFTDSTMSPGHVTNGITDRKEYLTPNDFNTTTDSDMTPGHVTNRITDPRGYYQDKMKNKSNEQSILNSALVAVGVMITVAVVMYIITKKKKVTNIRHRIR